ncbi:hypothetical protein BJ875DRAFT_460951 [Amylocarpus encephaloides]|uniref:Uncharacterized protein n=1 Tax=Amylocarpus encephaloides TaxID=45428 RepID=A0A9P8C5K8_9HELO|nr:hypothetical protein BJ875DRAFT_460951 [Amylocarpus encephaloides]
MVLITSTSALASIPISACSTSFHTRPGGSRLSPVAVAVRVVAVAVAVAQLLLLTSPGQNRLSKIPAGEQASRQASKRASRQAGRTGGRSYVVTSSGTTCDGVTIADAVTAVTDPCRNLYVLFEVLRESYSVRVLVDHTAQDTPKTSINATESAQTSPGQWTSWETGLRSQDARVAYPTYPLRHGSPILMMSQ